MFEIKDSEEDFFNEHYFGSELFLSDGFENIFEIDSQQPADKRPEELQAVMKQHVGAVEEIDGANDKQEKRYAPAFKPDPRVYAQVKDAFFQNIDEDDESWKEKVLHIPNAPLDVAGAKSFGFYAGWLHRGHSLAEIGYDPESKTWSKPKPDFVMKDISELKSYL